MKLYSRFLYIALFSIFQVANSLAQAIDPVIGQWKTIDDKTNTVKSIISIQLVNDQLQGTIMKTFPTAGEKPITNCDLCKDQRKGAPLIGMVIMSGLKAQSPGVWGGGEILDPKEGEVYKVKITASADGKKLDVRGYIGVPMLGRTQTWIKE